MSQTRVGGGRVSGADEVVALRETDEAVFALEILVEPLEGFLLLAVAQANVGARLDVCDVDGDVE